MSFCYSDMLISVVVVGSSDDDWDDSWDVQSTSVVHLSLED
jgi:hypothetical protein